MKYNIINIICALVVLVSQIDVTNAYEITVHEQLCGKAAEISNVKNFLINQLAISKGLDYKIDDEGDVRSIEEIIQDGGMSENYGLNNDPDAFIGRFFNHFHNPLKSWQDAYFDNLVLAAS